MGESGTEEFHRKVGERLEALYSNEIEDHYKYLAYHYSRSDSKEKAIHYLVKAGDKAKKAYATQQAIEYYNQALELMDEVQGTDPAMRGHIHLSLADAYSVLADYEKTLNFARKALKSSNDREERAESHRIIGTTYEVRKELDLSIEHLNLAVAELGSDTESPEMAKISASLFWPMLYNGRMKEAIEIAQQGLEIGKITGNYSAIAGLYICLVWVCMEPSYGINETDKGFEYAQKSIEAAQKSGDLYSIGHSTFWFGWAHMRKGEDDIAIKLMKDAIETYKKTGHNFHIHQAYSWLSGIYLRKGDLRGLMDMTKWVIER